MTKLRNNETTKAVENQKISSFEFRVSSLNNKGISLPLVIGLVLLLMMISVSVNELIIRALRNANQIESSDKAYFSAEAGIEDALYELSEHFAGYETGDIDGAVVDKRINNFNISGELAWKSDWEIVSLNRDSDGNPVGNYGYDNGLHLYPKQKLILPLYIDSSGTHKGENAINEDVINIGKVTAGNFKIDFRIPWDTDTGYSSPAFDSNELRIDNDGDLGISSSDGPENITGLNEDRPGDKVSAPSCIGIGIPTEDYDCDGREDEDSDQDAVILWKLTDNVGNTLVPVRGCLTGTIGDEDDPRGTEICEKDFSYNGSYLSVSLDIVTKGVLKDGSTQIISNFISNASNDNKVQLELLIVAPLEQVVDVVPPKKVSIPYIEYEILVDTGGTPPLPIFTINSDGWYKNYKQSITTTVTPKTAVPLFDFTIIQQQ